MRAIILAAGRGERMRPLTDRTPKPLLEVGGRPLIEHHLLALRAAGIVEVVVNSAHLGEQIREHLGDGARWQMRIIHSPEPEGALETGGGILNALEAFRGEAFVVVNGDIWCDFDYARMPPLRGDLAHLVLVDNPGHNPQGDFALRGGRVVAESEMRLTFAGLSVLHPDLFAGLEWGRFPLAPLLGRAIDSGRVSGERFPGRWFDIGTPQRLADLDALLSREDSANKLT